LRSKKKEVYHQGHKATKKTKMQTFLLSVLCGFVVKKPFAQQKKKEKLTTNGQALSITSTIRISKFGKKK
jgi:hypothetical protein